ncbi:hypothetical protein JR316_0006599 [Psilocybe cubensis]|uniref:Uncharacterized protein n=2 Tax=Psilocybe cubensis TaxID=181762 RepID=A0ACB8GX35_PSICU|nr:hypothetical protein JR316_0006599 [Psilocybe cubensis]KAH9480002.1 hypothetical protein JR316_0006599 [Psilocybe cubensis]
MHLGSYVLGYKIDKEKLAHTMGEPGAPLTDEVELQKICQILYRMLHDTRHLYPLEVVFEDRPDRDPQVVVVVILDDEDSKEELEAKSMEPYQTLPEELRGFEFALSGPAIFRNCPRPVTEEQMEEMLERIKQQKW